MSDQLIIFGVGGQVGHALLAAAPDFGFDPVGFTSAQADITDPAGFHKIAQKYPEAPVINAAAYTAVDAAETDSDLAFRVNAIGPAFLASIFGTKRPLVHFSTDYVFSGEATTPSAVDAKTSPLGVYGMSKRAGELAVLSVPNGTIIRTAWVYAQTGANFLKTMLYAGRERGRLKVVDDQIGTPTHAADIARGALVLLRAQMNGDDNARAGIYHLTAKGQTSWHGFAAAIFAALEEQTGERIMLEAIASTAYPTAAQRPAYSVLECSKIDKIKGMVRPQWQAPIAATVAEVLLQLKKV